jgi:integrase/recombinase XerD
LRQAPVLSERDKVRVLQVLSRESCAPRNRLMFMLSWLAGMRVGEIAALRIEDVLSQSGAIRTEVQLSASQTKGSTGRKVLLNVQMQEEIRRYVSALPVPIQASAPLIPSRTGKPFSANGLCQRFIQLYGKAGLDKATSHSGRRTFITELAHKGVNVRVLAALAGHRHIGTTQRYIELNDAVLRAAVELV